MWTELNQNHIVTEFVISRNIESSSKHIDVISYCDEDDDLHPYCNHNYVSNCSHDFVTIVGQGGSLASNSQQPQWCIWAPHFGDHGAPLDTHSSQDDTVKLPNHDHNHRAPVGWTQFMLFCVIVDSRLFTLLQSSAAIQCSNRGHIFVLN